MALEQTNKVHVVYVINAVKKSGPNEVLKNMVRAIDYSKYKVTVVSLLSKSDKIEVNTLKSFGADFIQVGLSRKRDIVTLAPKALNSIFCNIAPDVIHSHGILSDIAVLRSKYDAKYISTVHNNISEDYRYSFGRVKGALFTLWHIAYLRKADEVVFCSSHAYNSLKRLLPNSSYIHNGINIDRNVSNKEILDEIRTKLGIQSSDVVYIYAGKLSARKNILGLLKSFKNSHTTNEHLIVVGNGELYDDCLKYDNKNIHILGFQSNVNDYLDIANVYISASKSEGFSISVLEALGRGLYLLLSDIPSHKEVFKIDKSSYVGETFNFTNFGISKDALSIKMASKNIPRKFQNKYLTANTMMKEYEQLYSRIN